MFVVRAGEQPGTIHHREITQTTHLQTCQAHGPSVLAVATKRHQLAHPPFHVMSQETSGIAAYLENGGTSEHAQQIAAHKSPRTTKLYDRTSDQITLDGVERIAS